MRSKKRKEKGLKKITGSTESQVWRKKYRKDERRMELKREKRPYCDIL